MKTFISLQLKSHIISYTGPGLWGGSIFLLLTGSGQGGHLFPLGRIMDATKTLNMTPIPW